MYELLEKIIRPYEKQIVTAYFVTFGDEVKIEQEKMSTSDLYDMAYCLVCDYMENNNDSEQK